MMDLHEFAGRVQAMRDAQKAFFNRRTRTDENLQKAKDLERHVDALVTEILDPQPTLFADTEAPAGGRKRKGAAS